jgi:hypothetical protein
MYVMDMASRYDFTHGGPLPISTNVQEAQMRAALNKCCGQRLSYVLGAMNLCATLIANCALQAFGEADQRKAVDEAVGLSLPLVDYFDYVLRLTKSIKDHTLLKNAIEHAKQRCCNQIK